MRQRLRDQLSDQEDETWSAGEKDDTLQWSVRRLNQRLPRPVDPENEFISVIELDPTTYFYAVSAYYTHINAIEWLNANGDEMGYLQTGWEVVGDLVTGFAKLHISPQIAVQGGWLRLHGYGRYTLVTRTSIGQEGTDGEGGPGNDDYSIPDDYVPLVMAWARAECYRRLTADRARFVQWQVANQISNVSINELVQMVNDADRQAEDETIFLKRWQRPVIGRIGP